MATVSVITENENSRVTPSRAAVFWLLSLAAFPVRTSACCRSNVCSDALCVPAYVAHGRGGTDVNERRRHSSSSPVNTFPPVDVGPVRVPAGAGTG